MVEQFREKYTVTSILKVLGIPRASYYRWTKGFGEYRNEHE
ncbi:hypothetical protein ACTQ5K_25555, partial [Niallia sp. Sow4_A1]